MPSVRPLLAGMLIAGCSSTTAAPSSDRAPSASAPVSPLVGSFRPVSAAAPPAPSADQLLPEALAGTVASPGDALDSRVEVRKLDLPHPPRGATASFRVGADRRGWITALSGPVVLPSPTYADGKVFVGGGFSSTAMFAFDAWHGTRAWAMTGIDLGPTAAIAMDRELAFNTMSCDLYVAATDTGKVRWHKHLASTLVTQPVAADGALLSAWPESDDKYSFGALRASDGKQEWSFAIPADVIVAPQVVGDSVYFATLDGSAYRARTRDGHVVWKRDVGAASAVAVDGDRVLLTRRIDHAGTPREQRIVLDAGTGELAVLGEARDARYFAGATRDRQLLGGDSTPAGKRLGLGFQSLWSYHGGAPTIADGRAYFALGDELVATEIASGKDVWHRTYKQAAGAQALTPPAVVGGLLVFGSVDGHLYVADIDTGMTVAAWDLGEPIVAQPIVAQGWIYTTTAKGHLVGIELGDPSVDGWHMWGGNAQHAGLVPDAGTPDARALASLARPSEGTLRIAGEDSAGAPLPLLHTKVNVAISGYVAEVTLEQQFTNPTDKPLEADYLFPLPDNAAVDHMDLRIGDRVVHGVVQKRAEAAATYGKAKAEGKRAALLEQQRPNLFTQRVANIPPNARVDVVIRYVHELPFADGQYELVFPMVAAPRFDPKDPSAVLAKPGELRAANSVELAVQLHAGLPIEALASPTHQIRATTSGADATVELAATDQLPNRDFVLRYRIAGDTPRATVLAHDDAGDGYFSLVVQPPAAPTAEQIAPRELVFVVDTSSSMRGKPLDQARAIVTHALDGLRANDTFDVLDFSDRVAELAPAPVGASRAAEGKAFVANLRPTGGTDMVPAIEAALAGQPEGGRTRIVVLVTDGYIANEADVLKAIVGKLGASRIYTVGVGGSVNRFLLERAAEVGRGRALAVALSDAPEAAAARLAALVDRPVFTDVAVDWGGLDVTDLYPRHIPDLFAASPLVIHGRYAHGGHATVRVSGNIGTRRFERAIDVALPETSAGEAHEAQRSLWARAAVHDLTSRLALRDDPSLVAQVEQLGLKYQLVTAYTSFVAVDEVKADVVAQLQSSPTVTPARALPGDPEIRIPAPADARTVSVLLPSGETADARWDAAAGLWTARFLIPADAPQGSHPLDVFVTHADGQLEHLRVWYDVDTTAPALRLEVVGTARPGATVTLRAHGDADIGRITARMADGTLVKLHAAGERVWEAQYRIPDDARGTLAVTVIAIDLAANVRTQPLAIELAR
ncbi:MAG: VIT domain-containing protein [Acidobacteriota bacterium]